MKRHFLFALMALLPMTATAQISSVPISNLPHGNVIADTDYMVYVNDPANLTGQRATRRILAGSVKEYMGTIAATGSQKTRSLGEHFSNVRHAKDWYGVVCDGEHDDTAGLQSLLDFAALTPGNGTRIVLPSGTCSVSGLDQKSLTMLACEGSPGSCELRLRNGSNRSLLKSAHFDDLTDTGLNYGPTGNHNFPPRASDSRVPSWFGIENLHLDCNKANQTQGWCVQWYGNMQMMLGVNLIRNGKDGGIYTEASDAYAYNATDWRAQEEGIFETVISRNNNGYGWLFRGPHDAEIGTYIAYDNRNCGFRSEHVVDKYNGGSNIGKIHSYTNNDAVNTACGQYYGATMNVGQIYIDNDTLTIASNGNNISVVRGVALGYYNNTPLTISGNSNFIGGLRLSGRNTSQDGVAMVKITGERNYIAGGDIRWSLLAGEWGVGLDIAGSNNVANLIITDLTPANSVGVRFAGSHNRVNATLQNVANALEYKNISTYNNIISISNFANAGQNTLAASSDPFVTSDRVQIIANTGGNTRIERFGGVLGIDYIAGTVDLSAGTSFKTRTHTAAGAVAVSTNDFQVLVNKATGAATTVNLPANPRPGQTHVIKDAKFDAHINPITIVPNTGTIDGAANYVIRNPGGAVTLRHSGSVWNVVSDLDKSEVLVLAASDETTDLSAGTNKVRFRMPYAFTLREVRASVNTAPTGSALVVDVNENGSTVLSTKLSIDATEKTSTTAATPAVISDASLADDAEMSIDIDAVGSSTPGAGLKVYLIGTRN